MVPDVATNSLNDLEKAPQNSPVCSGYTRFRVADDFLFRTGLWRCRKYGWQDFSGAAARIQGTLKNSIYVHCSSHIFNLCVAFNEESTDKAVNLYHFLRTFEFVITLIIVFRCLEVTRPLTKQLQTACYDTGAARQKLRHAGKMRQDIESKHAPITKKL